MPSKRTAQAYRAEIAAHNKGWIAATIAMSEECDRIKGTMPQQWLPSDAQGIWNTVCDRLRATICHLKPSEGSAPFLEALTAAEVRGAATTKAEIAALTEQRDRAMPIVRRAAAAWDQLQQMYDGQDAERLNSGDVGSIHRDIFEAWLDSLTEDAKEIAALDAEAAAETAPSLPETP